jgi:hypothetical protein
MHADLRGDLEDLSDDQSAFRHDGARREHREAGG